MLSTFVMLTFLFAPGFAYWDDLGACIKEEVQEEKENNAINPTVKKLSDALIGCNNEIASQGRSLKDNDTFCDDFNKKNWEKNMMKMKKLFESYMKYFEKYSISIPILSCIYRMFQKW